MSAAFLKWWQSHFIKHGPFNDRERAVAWAAWQACGEAIVKEIGKTK